MSNVSIVRAPVPYELTFEGHEAIRSNVRCQCVKVLDCGLIQCDQCGTVYGTLADVLRGQLPGRKSRVD